MEPFCDTKINSKCLELPQRFVDKPLLIIFGTVGTVAGCLCMAAWCILKSSSSSMYRPVPCEDGEFGLSDELY